MPLLEQPRRPRPHPARFTGYLKSHLLSLGKRSLAVWPALWLVCQMGGFAFGGALVSSGVGPAGLWSGHSAVSSDWVIRATAALPVLLFGAGPGGRLIVWAAVTTGSTWAGAIETLGRNRRHSAVSEFRWTPAAAVDHQGRALVRVTGWSRQGRAGRWSVPVVLVHWHGARGNDGVCDLPRRGDGALVTGTGPRPSPGALLHATLSLRVPAAAAVPGGFDDRRFLAGRGLRWRGTLERGPAGPVEIVANTGNRLLSPLHTAIVSQLDRLLPGQEADVVAAVLLGVRTPESREVSRSFGTLGLAHLFAVSGLHVGILAAIILLPGRVAGAGPLLRAGPLLLFIPLYAVLTGLPGSVVRAGGMSVLAVLARPCGRRCDPLRLLGLLYWAGAVSDPQRLPDLGLQMSYLAAGGILLVSRVTDGYKLGSVRWLRPLLAGLTVSIAAQWFTLPLVAAGFGRISLVSPLANLVAVPVFGVAIWAIVLALGVAPLWPAAGWSLASLAWLGLRALSGGAARVADLNEGWNLGLPVPGLPQIVAWAGLTLLWLALLRLNGSPRANRLRRGVAWLVLPCVLVWMIGPAARSTPSARDVVVWQFDVGQGDCGIVSFPDGWTAMIDTGGRASPFHAPQESRLSQAVLPFLQRQGIVELDAVLLTHGHLDHSGGALALPGTLAVSQWVIAGTADRALPTGTDPACVVRPQAGAVLHRWREWELVILHPLGGGEAHGENDASLAAMLVRGDRVEMVWTGDLEAQGEACLLRNPLPGGPARVWKAGHHGSHTSGTPALLAALAPELVLISCGLGNRYGHPSHGPFLRASAGHSPPDTSLILRTDLDGSIGLRWGPNGGLKWHATAAAGQSGRMP